MNISMLQAMTATKMPQAQNAVETNSPDANAFGSVFQSIMSTSNQPTNETANTETPTLAEEVSTILATDSLEGLLEELGVEMDEAGLFVFVGEEQMPVAMDEMLTLENLTELLGMT